MKKTAEGFDFMNLPCIDTSVDGHMHTVFCNHARGTMEDYVLSGIKKGLQKIIFLEHLETGINYFESTWLSDNDFKLYFQEGDRLQKKFKGSIEIGLGVEVGYNPDCVEEILTRLARHEWDRVGISYHFLAAEKKHLNMVSSKQVNISALDSIGVQKVITAYFTDLQEAVYKLPGDVLCHFDAVLRYHPEIIFLGEYDALIDALLDTVAEKNMAIEVNTSGYRLRNEPYPSMAILKKAVTRGIPLVAGSDAHRPEDVGRYFNRLAKIDLSRL